MALMLHLNLLIGLLLVLGFSYIIWVLACKESGLVRLGGQILAIAIKLCVLVAFITLIVYGHKNGGLLKRCPMMGPGKMMMGGEMMKGKSMKMMEKMMGEKAGMMKMEKCKGMK